MEDGVMEVEFTLRCESGTYVKETIHGDGGRTQPSLSSLIKAKCDVLWLENKVTDAHLSAIPGRDQLNSHLIKLWNVERFGTPFRKGGRYFFSKNDGLQNQSVLYTTPALDKEATVLLDPNKLSTDGTVALKDYEISPDGKLMAYSTSTSGSGSDRVESPRYHHQKRPLRSPRLVKILRRDVVEGQ